MHIYRSTLKRALFAAFIAELRDTAAVRMEDLGRAWADTGLRNSDLSAAVTVLEYDGLARLIQVDGNSLLELTDTGLEELHRRSPLSADAFAERLIDHVLLTRLRRRHRPVFRYRGSSAVRSDYGQGKADRRMSGLGSVMRLAACKILSVQLTAVGEWTEAARLMDDWKATGLREQDFTTALISLTRDGYLCMQKSRGWSTITLKRPLPRNFHLNDRLALFRARRRKRTGRAANERRTRSP